MGHGRHPLLHGSPQRPLVAYLASTAAEQTGNVTFHYWPTRATGTGQVHLIGGALAVQARLIEQVEHLVGCRRGVDGRNGVWDAHGENAPRMQGLPHGRVVDAEVACHGMDGRAVVSLDPCEGVLNFINQREDIAGINGIAHRCMRGKNEACRGLRDETRLSTELSWAIALPLEDGGDGGVVGIDDFAVPKPFAMDELSRLFGNVLMGQQGFFERRGQVLAPSSTVFPWILELSFI